MIGAKLSILTPKEPKAITPSTVTLSPLLRFVTCEPFAPVVPSNIALQVPCPF